MALKSFIIGSLKCLVSRILSLHPVRHFRSRPDNPPFHHKLILTQDQESLKETDLSGSLKFRNCLHDSNKRTERSFFFFFLNELGVVIKSIWCTSRGTCISRWLFGKIIHDLYDVKNCWKKFLLGKQIT